VNLKGVFAQLQGKRVTIIGDIILDEYIWGDVNRISPEAPVPVFDMTAEARGCGGAANVAQNVAKLGGKAELLGVIGKDREGEKLVQMLTAMNIGAAGICTDVQRPTSTKTRLLANTAATTTAVVGTSSIGNVSLQQGHYLLRMDREFKEEISLGLREHVLGAVVSRLAESDAIIFSDYDKGVVSAALINAVVTHAQPYGVPIIVDPKRKNFWQYEGVTALTPNHIEAGAAVDKKITDAVHLVAVGEQILDRLSLEALLITREAEGMSLFQRHPDGTLQVNHLPPQSSTVMDVTGAGDTVVAVFTLALAANADIHSAAQLSSLAGGIVVGKMGCATVTPAELLHAIETLP